MRSLRGVFRLIRGNILVLTLTGALGMSCRSMVFPYASLYILSLGGTPEQIGLINSLRPLAGLIVFPIAGCLADLAGRVKLIALASYYYAAVLLLYIFAPGWRAIALASALTGFVVFQFPPSSAIIADSLSPENRAASMAGMNAIAGAVALVSPYIAGRVLDAWGVNTGMRYLYGVMMVISLISATIHLRFLKETSVRRTGRLTTVELSSMFRTAYSGIPTLLRELPRSLKALAALITLGFVANGIASPFWVVYAVDHIGLSSTEWGLILLLENVARNLALIPGGMLADRYGKTRTMQASLVLALVSVPLFVFATGFTSVLLIRLAAGVATALFSPACAALMADMVPRESRGRVMAAVGRGTLMIGPASGGTGGPGVGFVVTLPLMIASFSGGYLYALNPAYPWLAATVVTVISVALLRLLVRDPERAHR